MASETTDDFYNALKVGNELSMQQANDLIKLSLTGRITKAISDGEDTGKIKQLIDLMNELK